jgi:hypothetical protein
MATGIRCQSLALGVLTLALFPIPGSGEGFALPPGRYDVTAQMYMPHLEEMRRIVTHEQYCLRDSDPSGLFPVLHQPALRGCMLDHGEQTADSFEYVLVCETALGATGSARFDHDRGRVIGTINVKMGGKNMTFSQRIEARLSGACDEEVTPSASGG